MMLGEAWERGYDAGRPGRPGNEAMMLGEAWERGYDAGGGLGTRL